jgi:RND family efflux transporter MFP subunit
MRAKRAAGCVRVAVSDQLSSDLASLKIDRRPAPRAFPVRAIVWVAIIGALAVAGYVFGMPLVQARLLKTEVSFTEVSVHSPSQASVELTSSGYVEPQLITRVAPKIPGRVAAVAVREGDRVTKGTLLLELEHADRDSGVEAARMRALAAHARVATATANLAETRLQAKRQRALAEQGVAPAATAEDLEARAASLQEAVRAAEAEVKAADAEVATLRVDLQYMRVLAPIDGTIISKPPEVGELVGTDIGGGRDKVIELADFSTLMVETDIPEGRLHMVKLGSPAEITLDAFPGRRYRGESVEISSRVNRAKATVQVKVKFVDDAKDVLPDMSARVSFLTEAIDPASLQQKAKTVVPASAVVERGGAKVVFVLDGEAVRMRNVTLGERIGSGFELLDGPEVGARLVAEPPPDLTDGQQVKEKS